MFSVASRCGEQSGMTGGRGLTEGKEADMDREKEIKRKNMRLAGFANDN